MRFSQAQPLIFTACQKCKQEMGGYSDLPWIKANNTDKQEYTP